MILAASWISNCAGFIGRHPGLLLVLLGVIGEVIFDWKEMGAGKLARAKRFSAILLVLGLLIEFWEAAKSDEEVAKAQVQVKQLGMQIIDTSNIVAQANARISIANENAEKAKKDAAESNARAAKFDSDRVMVEKEAEEIRSTNLVLQIKLSELENKMQDRTITDENREKFINLLQYEPRGGVEVYISGDSGGEVHNYAERIREMIGAAGYDVGKMCAEGWGGGQIPKGVGIGVNSTTNYAHFAVQMQRAFGAIGIDAIGFTDPSIGTNGVKIFVGTKP